MTHGTMQDDRGGWRRTVWYDSAGRKHASLSVPRRRRPPVIEWIMGGVLGVAVMGGAFGLLVELVR
jgi:hypothetical protein